MSPFTPQNRDNMIAWLAARCDFPDYGKMLFYELPKEKLIYGPNQIAAMIDQNTTISQQLTLWDQKGSGVIRGKLVVIPIENVFPLRGPALSQSRRDEFSATQARHCGDRKQGRDGAYARRSTERPVRVARSPADRNPGARYAVRSWIKPGFSLRRFRKRSIRSSAC